MIFNETHKRILIKWERFRILYNLLLLVPGFVAAVAAASIHQIAPLDVLKTSLLFAIAANVCYFIGPVVEMACIALGIRQEKTMPVLFVSGVTFSFFVMICLILRIL